MRTVTYGVSGLIDWNAQIPVGRARLSVHFSGGAITKYGVTPAEYTTNDAITQRIIEDSEYYRNGKIRILRSVGQPEQVSISRKNDLVTREAYEAATLPLDNHTESLELHFCCLEDARTYLIEKHNVPSLKITSKLAVIKVASELGINIQIDNP